MTKNKKADKILSILLVIALILPLLPIGEIKAYAYDEAQYSVTSVTLYKIYDKNRQPTERRLTINGKYLKDASVYMTTNEGSVELTNREQNTETTLQFILKGAQVGSQVKIGSTSIDLSEGSMPTLTQVSPEVKSGYEGNLVLKGTNFSKISAGEVKAEIYKEGARQNISTGFYGSDEEANISNISLSLGLQDIVFTKESEVYENFNQANPNGKVKVAITYTYKNQFLLYQDIDVDGLEMRPDRGSKGDTLFIEAPVKGTSTDLREYDVFFLKSIEGRDTYKLSNKGKNRSFRSKVLQDDKEYNVLTVEVPDLDKGDYFVVLTNVADGSDPTSKITQRKVLDRKFTVVDGTKKPYIQTVAPAFGPDTGSKTTLSGKFLGTMNIDEFQADTPDIKEISATGSQSNILRIKYGPGKFGEKKEDIISATRELKVIIGGEASFLKKGDQWDVSLDPGLDTITVKTGQISIGDTDPVKDVVVEITTVFTKASGDKITIRERAEKKKAYRYILSTIEPEIKSIVPEKIEVVAKGLEYEIPEDRMVAIYGEKFMVYKYRDNEGNEVFRYPIIRIGNITIDKNKNPQAYLRVFKTSGEELDGTQNNEQGQKILVMLAESSKVLKASKEEVAVQNPIRNSTKPGLQTVRPDFVEFVVPDPSTIPAITTVTPDTVSVDGGDQVTIVGNNFQGDVKVIIDGEYVNPIKRKQDGTEISFKAPKGREGETQLQVINGSGAMDTRPFFYVKTFTNPKIIDFNPKKGNSGTLVMIKGENFLGPDPTGTEENIFRLIGTRVFLDDYELNEYNRNPKDNRIQLIDYKPNDPIFEIVDRKIEVKPYYQGILLEDGNKVKYTISLNTKGGIRLSNGGLINFDIETDSKGKIIGIQQGGSVYEVKVAGNSISLLGPNNEEINLNYLTPYKLDSNNKIVGQKVRVIDGETIYFTVPVMNNQAQGYKDLKIMNPDTKKDEKKGNNGFFFVKQPDRRPLIDKIIPNEGSVAGGYSIEIIGKDFETNKAEKPKVYINLVEVPEKDTIVDKSGTKITVVVPKYVGDLKIDKDTDRWPVPVVVLNPDGGTANKEDGFFYVIPNSQPVITEISPIKGTAAGGNIVEIWGRDFRYFEPFDDLNGNLEYDKEDGETFNDINKNGIWDDLRNRDIENWDEKAGLTKLQSAHAKFDSYYDSPILPKIYFGNKTAKILEFDVGYMKVLVPAHIPPGKVDVFLLNNDGGVSGSKPYTYESKGLEIVSVIPGEGKIQGGEKIELHGTGFENSLIEIYDLDNSITTKTMPIIRLGNRTNRDLARDHTNSGSINLNRATVELEGGLKVEYNGVDKNLRLSIEEEGKTYTRLISNYDDREIYVAVDSLKAENTPYQGRELIRLAVGDPDDKEEMNRLLVDRGYAVESNLINETHIVFKTPSRNIIGKTKVYLINPDGGRAEGDFEYTNPDSKPSIENIKKEGQCGPIVEFRKEINGCARILKINYKGESTITIEGKDFRPEAIVEMSNLLSIGKDQINYTKLPRSLSFQMPILDQSHVGRLLPVLVQNKDGGIALSDESELPIYIEITSGDSNPKLTSIEPNLGSATGGTKVTIKGLDFRDIKEGEGEENEKDKLCKEEYADYNETNKDCHEKRPRVYFGDVEAQIIGKLENDSIEVIAPEGNSPGQVKVRVENPDGERTSEDVFFTYISKPKINDINPKKIFANDEKTLVTITGQQFLKDGGDPIVVVGGEILAGKILPADLKDGKILHGSGISGVDGDGKNIESSVVGGIKTASLVFEDQGTLKVSFSEKIDLENTSIIVINPDGGISEPYKDFKYELPIPLKPLVLEGIAGNEKTVMLVWNKSSSEILNKSSSYEIYGRKTSEKNNLLIANTEGHEYLVRGLEENTSYTFMVRALNEYGAAIDFATVEVKTLSQAEDKKQKEKEDKLKEEEKNLNLKGKETITGKKLEKTLGRENITNGVGLVDLTLSKYKDMDEYTIKIPLALARVDSTLIIKDKTLNLSINPKDLYSYKVSTMDSGDKDANLIVHIKKARDTNIGRKMKTGSLSYSVDFSFQASKNTIAIDKLLRSGKISLNLDTLSYGDRKDVKLYSLDLASGEYKKASENYTSSIDKSGKYILLYMR